MGSGHAGVVPEAFGRIELGRVGRQVIHLPPGTVRLEPGPYVLVFVIRRIVLDVNDGLGVVAPGDLFEIVKIGLRVEHRGPVIQESGRVDLNAAKNLHTFACPSNGNIRLTTASGPRLMQRRILTETGLILKNQRGCFRAGFFFMSGYV